MAYWKFKSCPRCHGDVFVEREGYSTAAYCLQCGARSYFDKKPKVQSKAEVQQRDLATAR